MNHWASVFLWGTQFSSSENPSLIFSSGHENSNFTIWLFVENYTDLPLHWSNIEICSCGQDLYTMIFTVPSLLSVLRESHTILSRVFLQHTAILEPVLLLLSAYIGNRQGANRVVIVTAKCSFSSSPLHCLLKFVLRGHFLYRNLRFGKSLLNSKWD